MSNSKFIVWWAGGSKVHAIVIKLNQGGYIRFCLSSSDRSVMTHISHRDFESFYDFMENSVTAGKVPALMFGGNNE